MSGAYTFNKRQMNLFDPQSSKARLKCPLRKMDNLDVITDYLISIWLILSYSSQFIQKEWSYKPFDFHCLSVIKRERIRTCWMTVEPKEKECLVYFFFWSNPCSELYVKLNTFNAKKGSSTSKQTLISNSSRLVFLLNTPHWTNVVSRIFFTAQFVYLSKQDGWKKENKLS